MVNSDAARLKACEDKPQRLGNRRMAKVSNVYPEAAVVVLVIDNLNTHCIGSIHEGFDPATA